MARSEQARASWPAPVAAIMVPSQDEPVVAPIDYLRRSHEGVSQGTPFWFDPAGARQQEMAGLVDEHAAVHRQRDACDVARLVGDEEERGVADVPARAFDAERG